MSTELDVLPPIELNSELEFIPVLDRFEFATGDVDIPLTQVTNLAELLSIIDPNNQVDFPSLAEIQADPWCLAFYLLGGYELRHQGELILAPQCCGDLDNMKEWEAVCHYREANWTMLWIGHPWSSARYENSRLILTEPCEQSDPNICTYAIHPDKLTELVSEAKVVTNKFLHELIEALINFKNQ